MRRLRWFLVLVVVACALGSVSGVVRFAGGAIPAASLMVTPVKWDKDANVRQLDAAVRQAQQKGARLIVAPEGALEGYVENEVIRASGQTRRELTARFNRLAEPCDGPYIRHFQKLCGELRVYLVLGLLESDAGRTYNTAILISPEGKTLGKYRKTHFAQGYRVGENQGDNPAGYTRGNEYPVFQIESSKVGIMICFDRRVPEVARRLVASGADFLVNPSYGKVGDCNRDYVAARARENHVPILFVHPRQTVLCTADGEVKLDVRPQKGDDRSCLVSIDVPSKRTTTRP